MRDGICVRCGASTVRAARNGIVLGERPESLVRPHIDPGFRGAIRTHGGEIWQLVCTTCGHLEWAIYDAATLAFIEQHWRLVPAGRDQPSG